MPRDRDHPRERVLVVERDGEFAGALAAILARNGYEATIATNVADAAAALSRHPVLAALFDLDTLDFAAPPAASLFAAADDTPIVAMATAAAARTVIDSFRRGAHDFLLKSDADRELPAVLARCAARSGARAPRGAETGPSPQVRNAVEAANRAKSEFIAAMSHELRTPLHVVIGFSELLLREGDGLGRGQPPMSYVEDIHTSGLHLLDIINNILDLSRAEAGTLELSETEVDMREIVAAARGVFGPRLKDARVELAAALPADLPLLWCDEKKVKKVVLDLLGNAVKFTPADGRIEIAAASAGGVFTVTVRDTGIGIAKSDLARVMLPFAQADSSAARPHQGAGLGLTLAKLMMEVHGGMLQLDSEVGHGTTVRLVFPAERIVAARDIAVARGRV